MQVTVWTSYREVCLSLMFEYAALFTELVESNGGEDSLIWFHYISDQNTAFWKDWVKAAKKVRLIYDGEVK